MTHTNLRDHSQVIIAESFGGRDEPVDTLITSLVDVGAEVVVDPLRVKDLPGQALYQGFEEAGAPECMITLNPGPW